MPLNNLGREQSARGINVHYIVYGMKFDKEETPGLIRAPRLELAGDFPTGKVYSTGMRPEFEPTRIRIKCPGVRSGGKILCGYWYPPPSAQPA